jgi:hypothetical protein
LQRCIRKAGGKNHDRKNRIDFIKAACNFLKLFKSCSIGLFYVAFTVFYTPVSSLESFRLFGKDFASFKQITVMFLAQITSAPLNPNEISLIFGLVVTFLFYRQYKKYEQEMEKEEMIGRFLGN